MDVAWVDYRIQKLRVRPHSRGKRPRIRRAEVCGKYAVANPAYETDHRLVAARICIRKKNTEQEPKETPAKPGSNRDRTVEAKHDELMKEFRNITRRKGSKTSPPSGSQRTALRL